MPLVLTCRKCGCDVDQCRCYRCGQPVDIEQLREAISATRHAVDECRHTRHKGLATYVERSRAIVDDMNILRREVDEAFTLYMDQIIQQKQKIEKEINDIQTQRLCALDLYKDAVGQEVKRADSLCNRVDKSLCEDMNHVTASALLQDCRQLLTELRSTEERSFPNAGHDVVFITDSEDVAAVISTLGYLQEGECPYSRLNESSICFGKFGSAVGQLDMPNGLAFRDDSMYVVDSNNHRVCKFSEQGEFLTSFGSRGDKNGEFNVPIDVTVSPQGHVVVTDTENHRIQVFTEEGIHVRSIGTKGSGPAQFDGPFGVYCDSKEKIYVCDRYNHRVEVVTIEGQYVRSYRHLKLGVPTYVVVNGNSEIIVTDWSHDQIQIFAQNGVLLSTFAVKGSAPGQLISPQGICVDREGYILVSNSGNHRIDVFNNRGGFVTSFGSKGVKPGQFDGPVGLSILPDGKLAIADHFNCRVQIFGI